MIKSHGFTLIELMLTVTILGIVAAFALPSFNQMIEKNRNREVGRQLFGSLNYARALAVSRGKRVVLCASSDSSSCSGDDSWTAGAIVFVDENANNDRDASEELLQAVPPAPAGSSLQLNAGGSAAFLKFKPDGRLTNSGNFQYCPKSRSPKSGWIIVFYWSGRPYFGKDNNGDGVVENGSGENLSC